MKILLLEDDIVLSDIYTDFLSETFKVTHTYSSKKVLELIEDDTFDIYIFDINVADMTGIELLKKIRALKDYTPTIFITAYQDTQTLTQGFDAGASDFIRKPFELEELLVRINNIKRLVGINEVVSLDPQITFDTVHHQINRGHEKSQLSNKESALLTLLYNNKNRTLSLEEILHSLWEYDEMPGADTVRTYVKTLRRLIGKEHIINIRGEGYRYE